MRDDTRFKRMNLKGETNIVGRNQENMGKTLLRTGRMSTFQKLVELIDQPIEFHRTYVRHIQHSETIGHRGAKINQQKGEF